MAVLLPQNNYCSAAPLVPTPIQDNVSKRIEVSLRWVNRDLVLEVQRNPYGTTCSGNSTDKITEQSTLTFSLDNDTGRKKVSPVAQVMCSSWRHPNVCEVL
jgi:hypothetical protein